MTQTNCPRCDSTRLRHQESYGYWECFDCGHTWAFDADDPDYEDDIVYFDRTLCNTCSGGGLIQEDGELHSCPMCGGSGSR
jgi:ribosomal protein L37AE/L43A